MKGLNGWASLGYKSYQEYLASDYWKEKRKWILFVLGNKCSKCESNQDVQVHHKNYDSVGNENIHDVILLCRKCHQEEHNG